MQHNIQARNLNPVEVEHLNSNSFMISPISLGPSKAVTTIVNSPDASIIFLKCFLAAEKHWLRSLDQDTDIDKVFWGRIAKSFNRKGLGYRINEAETARAVACILRSTSYITSMKQQHPRQDDVLQRLFSAIDDCRLMSLRRRQQQRLGLEHAQSLIDNQVTEEVVEKGILTKIPQNLKEYHNFMSALRMNEVNKGGTAAVAPIAIAEPRLADRETRNKGFLNPHIFTTNPNTQTTKRNITRPNIPRNCLTGPRRMMQVTNKRIGQRGSHRAQDRSSYSSARRSKSHFRGTTSLEKYQQQKIHRLERQLKEEQCRKRLF
ncbi:hypothetical protein F5B22DRAFT_592539 [Xylaria bambusicola]|uniref:uncharacterized protein n=1 Tax=Xylaria bambusicola TaxID=326684 RepID=UPI002007FEDD|nr:uncharacterized protein F5B22DRAFT_592539 [Xylaria bambusicola]KAI0523933.1 hypothetical protein F5B22DRAFT_592539 [Xylaria bambusicola]